jgi:hypothetical protein
MSHVPMRERSAPLLRQPKASHIRDKWEMAQRVEKPLSVSNSPNDEGGGKNTFGGTWPEKWKMHQ